MKNSFTNPWAQASFLTAASIGVALLSNNGQIALIAAAGLNAAAGVVGNLVASRIQNDAEAKVAVDALTRSKSVAARIGDILEAIILDEKSDTEDEETPRIARLAKSYWLELHSKSPESTQDVHLPVDQLVSQLLNPSDQLVLMQEWVDVLRRCESDSACTTGELRLNQLAGALTRKFPEQLNHSFFADLNQDDSGFSEIVLHMLVQIVEAVKHLEVTSQEYPSASARVEMLVSGAAATAERSYSVLSENATEILTRLKEFRGEMEMGISKLMGGQSKILEAVNEVATKLRKPEEGYISALETVAAIHGISADQLRIVLIAHATQIPTENRSSKPATEAALAAGDLEQAETTAIEWFRRAKLARDDSEAATVSARKEGSEALRYAGLAALRKGDSESALRYYQESLTLITRDRDLDEWISTQEGIAGSLIGLNKPDLAIKVVLEVHEASKGAQLGNPKRVFWNTYTLGMVLSQLGDLTHAEQCLSKAFNIAQKNFQRDDPVLAASLHSLAVLAIDKQDFSRAEEVSKKHLGLLQETGHLESINAVAGFYTLGKIQRLVGKFSDSEKHHIMALALAGEHLDATHGQRGLSFNELGLVHQNQGRDKDAEQDFKMAISIEEAAGRVDSLLISDYAANLGRLYGAKRQCNEAKQYLGRTAEIRKVKLGGSHPKTIEVLFQHNQVDC